MAPQIASLCDPPKPIYVLIGFRTLAPQITFTTSPLVARSSSSSSPSDVIDVSRVLVDETNDSGPY